MSLTDNEIQFGKDKVKDLSELLGLTYEQTLVVLANDEDVRGFYNWVKADEFILFYAEENK